MAQSLEKLKSNGTTTGDLVVLDLNQVTGIKNEVIKRKIIDLLNSGTILTSLQDDEEADRLWSSVVACIILDKVNDKLVDTRLIDFTIETEIDIISKIGTMHEVLYFNFREDPIIVQYREWLMVQLELNAYGIIIGSTLPTFDLAIVSNIIMQLNMCLGYEYLGHTFLEVL